MENKPRLNFMDILIILIIIGVLAVGIYFVAGRNAGSAVNGGEAALQQKVQYQIQLTKCEKEVADRFAAAKENKEPVWVGQKERAEATIVDVLVEPAKKQTRDTKKQTVVMAEIPDLYDVTVTLQSLGRETENDVRAGDVVLHVGEEALVKGKGFAGFGFVTDLKIVE